MEYLTIAPPIALRAYVRTYWTLEHKLSSNKPYIHRTVADGCAELLFHYKGRFDEMISDQGHQSSFRSGLHAQSQNFRRFVIKEDFGMFGVQLYPFAIPLFFGLPASEVTDQLPDLRDLLGSTSAMLEDKMMLAQNNTERTAIINEFLLSRFSRNDKKEPAVFSIISKVILGNGLTTVSSMAEEANLSARQFERKFKEFSGFSPKLFARITRFQAAICAAPQPNKTLTEIAYEAGYYDQSHFIHDFKTFSGQNPKLYFSTQALPTIDN